MTTVLNGARTAAFLNALPAALLARVRTESLRYHALESESAASAAETSDGGLAAVSRTHWFGDGDSPRCAIEEAVVQLKEIAIGGGDVDSEDGSRFGCEWWVQKRGHTSPMVMHFDTDMCLQADTGTARFPTLSSVMYLSASGGPTVVLDQVLAAPGWFSFGQATLAPNEVQELDLIHPHPNQYAVFRGNLLHGVLPGSEARGGASNDPHGLCGLGGERVTLLVNYWPADDKPAAPCCTRATDGLTRVLLEAGQQEEAGQLAAVAGGDCSGDSSSDGVGPVVASTLGSSQTEDRREQRESPPLLHRQTATSIDMTKQRQRDLTSISTDVCVAAGGTGSVTSVIPTGFFVPETDGIVGMASLTGMGRVRLVQSFYDN